MLRLIGTTGRSAAAHICAAQASTYKHGWRYPAIRA